MLTFGSLFSGAGGFDLGFQAAGMSCAFQVEIDKTAASVLAKHWPETPRFDDVLAVGSASLPSCDILVGGFPCQDLSVAGKRGGLEGGTRSGLFYELARIASELRPRFIVWENVPGLLSSDNGRDFARVLRHLADCGFHGGWRVLDARHFGVAQRRRRVFGVFARGRAGAESCAEVLALREGVCGDTAASREEREGSAGRLAQCLRASGVGTERAGDTRGQGNVVVAASVTSKWAKGSGGPAGDECQNLVVGTLRGHGTAGVNNQAVAAGHTIAFSSKDHGADAGELSPTLLAMGHDQSHANAGGQVAVFQTRIARNGRGQPEEVVGALTSAEGGSHADSKPHIFGGGFGVRRLTPRECERLQGWPDDHTRYRSDGSEIADGPRYRLIGNGVAEPCARWIARRLLQFGVFHD